EEHTAHVITTEGHRPPEDATTFGYMDWATLLNGVYEGARSLAGFAGELPVDVAKLPAPGVFTRFYKPTVFFSRTIPKGVYYRNESSFGPEVWAGLVGAGLLVGAAVNPDMDASEDESMGEEVGEDMEAEDADASEKSSASDALHERTKAEMEHLETFLAVYRVEAGTFPASLDVLLMPTKNYPKGFVGKSALPNDGWDHAFKYAQKEGGQSYRIWSMGPDGIDQDGKGDDVVD
ncbi:MAG TPA: type II secretion system protein GspG, partial [Planctomycetota bacterium]|nr:type II secretion system protein GspG [Planctomycetota bacterium]